MNRSMQMKNLKVRKCDIEMKRERQTIDLIANKVGSVDPDRGTKILSAYKGWDGISRNVNGFGQSTLNTDPVQGKKHHKGLWCPSY